MAYLLGVSRAGYKAWESGHKFIQRRLWGRMVATLGEPPQTDG